jgi:hypothetical protein
MFGRDSEGLVVPGSVVGRFWITLGVVGDEGLNPPLGREILDVLKLGRLMLG